MTTTVPAFPTGTILGYPRIGRRRELKKAVEAFWAGRIDAAELSIQLEVEPTPEGQREIGISHAAALAEKLIAGGAPGLHLYAFNQHETVLAVLDRAGALAPAQPVVSAHIPSPTHPSTSPVGTRAGIHSTKDYN